MDENTEIKTSGKKAKTLPIEMSRKASKNMLVLQGTYQGKYGKFITLKKLGTLIFERADPSII